MIYKHDHVINYEMGGFKQVIKVIGVGGGGSNAVNHMIENGFGDVGYVVCNTDAQALEKMDAKAKKLQLGAELTKGLGAGTDPEMGRKAALESEAAIRELLSDKTEMVFITAGMGGGTGTGAAPVIAKIARELDLLVVAVVSDPFSFEGNKKIRQAEEGIRLLKENCDTVLVIKNALLQSLHKDLSVKAAYKKADEVLANGVKSIAELITSAGEINCDFADVKMVLKNAGQAMMGSATGSGDNRAVNAIKEALESPLLENNKINGAKRILVSIAYSDEKPEYEIKMADQTLITDFIQNEIQDDAEVFKHGYSIDRTLKDSVRVTVVAAGFGEMVRTATTTTSSFQKIKTIIAEKSAEELAVEAEMAIKLQAQKMAEDKRKNNQQLVEYFLKNDFRKQNLSNEPSFSRWGGELPKRDSLNEELVEKYPLYSMYEGLKNAGIIRG